MLLVIRFMQIEFFYSEIFDFSSSLLKEMMISYLTVAESIPLILLCSINKRGLRNSNKGHFTLITYL